jgi:hypothetical protein
MSILVSWLCLSLFLALFASAACGLDALLRKVWR